MAIEFRCPACNKLLQTGPDTAGKQARCPECGAICTVPAQEPSPPSGYSQGSPFGPVAPPPPPGGQAVSPFAQTVAHPGGPYVSAAGYAAPPGVWNPTRIEFGDIFSRTWAIFQNEWGMCVVVVVLVLVISIAGGSAVGVGFTIAGRLSGDREIAVLLSLMSNLITVPFGVWLGIGQSLYFLKVARGQKAELADIFSGTPYLLPVLGGTIVVGLVTLLGYVMCIIPGIMFNLMFSQFYYLILDRRVGVMDSLGISTEITSGNKLMLLLIYLVATIVGVVIAICTCLVGILAVAPFMALLSAVVYLAITGQPTADQYYPQAPAV